MKEVILSILIATPMGLALVVILIWIGWLVAKEIRKWWHSWDEALDDDVEEVDGEEVVYW